MELTDTNSEPTTVDAATRRDYVAAATRRDYVAAATSPVTAGAFELVSQVGPGAVIDANPPATARADRDRAARLIEQADKLGMRTIVPGDEEWPRRIEDLNRCGTTRAPLCLWARGPARLDAIIQRAVLVTGSRSSTAYGNFVAQQIGYQLADGRQGWAVANGGQFGIDTEALKGAMVATCHTPQLVMLPCGLDRLFPSQRADMLQAVATTGLLVSANPPGALPSTRNAHHRMNILAALTTATVIVEAIDRSSCLPVAHRAAGMNRAVLAVPGPVTSVHSVGCHQLIRDGVARLVTDAADILAALSATPGA